MQRENIKNYINEPWKVYGRVFLALNKDLIAKLLMNLVLKVVSFMNESMYCIGKPLKIKERVNIIK